MILFCRKSYTRRQKNTISGDTVNGGDGGCRLLRGYDSGMGTSGCVSSIPSSSLRKFLRYLQHTHRPIHYYITKFAHKSANVNEREQEAYTRETTTNDH